MYKNINQTSKYLSIAIFFMIVGAFLFSNLNTKDIVADDLSLDEQELTIRAIQNTNDAVVNIIVYDEEDRLKVNTDGTTRLDTEKVQKGRGTGFIISSDGYILTNKHVVTSASEEGSYRIILSTGKQYYAQLIGKDPLNDLAVLKIFDQNLPFVNLGNSDNLQIGTTVIAIGNALGEYQNSATKGIVSGLGRNIIAADGGDIEALDNVIQTDAEINPGNSGGPLLNLKGEVIGVNVAIDNSGAAIGFAIPINDARPVINSIIEQGRIVRPKLGLRYMMLSPEIAIDNGLSRTDGAWISAGDLEAEAIVPGGPADLAGLRAGDIIFEVNAIKVEGSNTLLSIVQRYKVGDKIGMKVQRGEKILIIIAELGEF